MHESAVTPTGDVFLGVPGDGRGPLTADIRAETTSRIPRVGLADDMKFRGSDPASNDDVQGLRQQKLNLEAVGASLSLF